MKGQLRLRKDVLEWREIEGEVVAVDIRKSVYLAVNRTGAVLWPALVDGATKEELVGRLIQAFDVNHGMALSDVEAFVGMLDEQDLLER